LQVHDAQLDYYGRRLATCSSDRLVKVRTAERRRAAMARARGSRRPRSPTPLSQVFDVAGDTTTQLAELAGHEGPVWAVAWAHPSFGTLLASASFDNRVILWREDGRGGWARSHDAPPHGASVNAVAFAPHELGLSLAAASSDGCLSVLTSPDGGLSWGRETVDGAHAGGALAVAGAGSGAAGTAPTGTDGGEMLGQLLAACDELPGTLQFAVLAQVLQEKSGEFDELIAEIAAESESELELDRKELFGALRKTSIKTLKAEQERLIATGLEAEQAKVRYREINIELEQLRLAVDLDTAQ
jgi:hypothetical protein